MALVLRLKVDDTLPIEAESLRPDHLVAMKSDEVRALPVYHGNRARTVGDCFACEGDAADGVLILEGDCGRVKHIGQNMAFGAITVRGAAGMHLGAEMTGGTIEVEGRAGDWVGAEMRGGTIRIRGDAGHLVGGCYRGGTAGMKGGAIIVEGDAGNEVGCNMRRGLIAIVGSVGDFAGFNMIAGSIFVGGHFGVRCGAGMRRGTVVALDGTDGRPDLLPTFRFDCHFHPQFMGIYVRQLRRWGFPVEAGAATASYARYSGDLVGLGKGEILIRDSD